jgi:hypothetical protein
VELRDDRRGGAQTLYRMLAVVVCAISIYLFFFRQINTRFTWLFGEEYDAVIEAVLVSHWFHVFQFAHHWNEPLYFYPYRDILGYNDGYFLYGLLSIPFRLAGFNLLVSQELVHMVVKIIGFASMVALLGRLQTKNIAQLLGAALFTLCISSSTHAAHGQLLCVAFAPLVSLLLLDLYRSIVTGNGRGTLTYGIAFSVLYGALLLTGFYMAWFCGLFLILFALCALVLARSEAKVLWRQVMRLKLQVGIALLSFVASALPFALVYLPKLKETGGQSYSIQQYWSLHYVDILNYGDGSLLWGTLFALIREHFPDAMRPGEFQVGFTPDVVLLLGFAIFKIISRKVDFPVWVKATVYALLISLALPVSIDGHSLWFFVNKLIPGANGMRVVARYYTFLAFPVCVLITAYFSRLWSQTPQTKFPIFFVLSIACLGQVNIHKIVNLNVPAQMSIIDGAPPIPAECKVLFVANPIPVPDGFVPKRYRQNIQAMLLADRFGVPTLNGIATFDPPDWAFSYAPEYLRLVKNYIDKWNLTGVCKYDVQSRTWQTQQQIDFTADE